MAQKSHLIISGTGRAGTTFLVQLFTVLGFDTGFKDPTSALFANCNAGMEHDLRTKKKLPYVVKSPWMCEYLAEVLAEGKVVVDHAIVPMRDLFSAAESRRSVQRRTEHPEQYGTPDVPGGLVGTACPEEQEAVLQRQFYQLMEALTQWDVPTTTLSFPRFIHEPKYLYAKLRPVLGRMSYRKFSRGFRKVVKPELVHNFNPALDAQNRKRAVRFEENASWKKRVFGLLKNALHPA